MYVHWLYLSACLLKTSCCSPISIILKIMCLKQALSMPKSPLTAARNAFYSVNIQWTFNYNLCASSGLWHHEGDPWGGACPDQWGVQEAGRVPGRIGTGLARSVPRHIPVSSSHRLKTGLSTDITAHLQTPPRPPASDMLAVNQRSAKFAIKWIFSGWLCLPPAFVPPRIRPAGWN